MSTITITNNFNAPIGQHIDHVDKIEAHFDKDMGMHIEMGEEIARSETERYSAAGCADSIGGNGQSEGEKPFRYISPYVTDEVEREKIHRTIRNLVTSGFRLSAICAQLKELIKDKKIAMYVSTTDQYAELVRLGLPKNTEGYSQKNYENYMSEQKR